MHRTTHLPGSEASPLSVVEYVMRSLRTSIYNGDLAPGTRLVEQDLAERFDVSHIPIREALARLSEEGLVDRTPRRGARVATLDLWLLEEVSAVRKLLEQYVVELAQQQWSDSSHDVLLDIVKGMQRHAKAGNAEAMFELDCRFHETLWELSGNAVLFGLAAHLRGRINRFLLAANRALSKESLRAHAASHLELLEAVASGDLERARLAMALHIDIAANRIRASLIPADDTRGEDRQSVDQPNAKNNGNQSRRAKFAGSQRRPAPSDTAALVDR